MKTRITRKTLPAKLKSFVRSVRPKSASSPRSAQTTELRFKTLFVPIDFSECSIQALHYATSLARQFGGQIELFHAVEPKKVFNDPKSPYAKWDEWVLDTAGARLSELAAQQIDAEISVRTEACIGNSYQEICAAARKQNADLIVIGTHGRTGLKHVFLGSTAERVVRHAPCSVLVVREMQTDVPAEFAPRKILVPLDFSNGSKKALNCALSLARQFQARVQLLHVIPTLYAVGDYDYFDYAMLESELKDSAEKQLSVLAKGIQSKGISVETMLLHGRPATEIVEAARGLDSGLIVISTHGRTGIQHVLLGSNTEEVMRHASCPVLALREPKRKV